MNMRSSKGISLISLIITIIVIIILAAIVIFSGMGTPEKAQFAAVVSDIDNVQTAVDQACYGLYAEKAVAEEVWSKSQLYEAVATGETNRANLTEEGIVAISKDGLVKMSLPNYEGRTWGVALEDIDENTKIGSVVLYPGFETDGKVYSTLLDVQNTGRAVQLAQGVKKGIEVTNIRIKTDLVGMQEAGTGIKEGTTLYINFDANQDGMPVSVSPSLPFAITTNGSYEFILTNSEGKEKKYVVEVTNYNILTVANTLQIGDYVSYAGDVSNSYTLNSELTGYDSENGNILKPETVTWRVWDKKADGTAIIIPTKRVNAFYLKGENGFINSSEIIESVCDLYTNSKLGVTAEDVRSLKIEDLENTKVSSDMIAVKEEFQKDSETNPQYGMTNAEKYGNSGYTTGTFYVESNGKTVRKTPNIASSTNPVIIKQTYYLNNAPVWNNLNNDKFPSDTYGTILGAGWNWLASTCANLGSDGAVCDVFIAYAGGISARGLYFSTGKTMEYTNCVRPLVSLNSKLRIDITDETRDGSKAAKAWKFAPCEKD